MTCRRLVSYASDTGSPMLCFHAGGIGATLNDHVRLARSPFSIPVDQGLAFDPFFMRHYRRVLDELGRFRPDVIHITGLNDISILGAIAGHKLNIPVIASWHTNLHEFAAGRLNRRFSFLPSRVTDPIIRKIEATILSGTMQFYRIPQLVLAPNQELIDTIASRTKRPARMMTRGVDAEHFNPYRRNVADGVFRIGYVGRLRAEKNPFVLADLEDELIEAGISNFEFLIVGDGDERPRLEARMKHAVFTGYLEGDALAEAYANMDVFVFPSESDAFGNVIQEAAASGVPSIVTAKGGPKFIVDEGRTGFVAGSFEEMVDKAKLLIQNPEMLKQMSENARHFAEQRSWNAVFSGVYDAYRECVEIARQKDIKSSRNANPEPSAPSLATEQ